MHVRAARLEIMSNPSLRAMPPLRTNFANPADVINFLKTESLEGRNCALIVVTGTHGGGVRAPGALAGVSEQGNCAGYISNGCVDADMFSQALAAIKDGTVRTVRYGAGSPYLDIRLPCGGAVDLMIIPNPALKMIVDFGNALDQRQSVVFSCSSDNGLQYSSNQEAETGWINDKFYVRCNPKMRLRIAGRGTEPIALMRAAHALDLDVLLQSPDADRLEAATALGYDTERLISNSIAPKCMDDSHTAFVMMFHDHDWETELLIEALKSQAFYIGALGGRKTHASRCKALAKAGVLENEIVRIRGPIGLVSSVRNASYLAVSVLAEIIDVYENG